MKRQVFWFASSFVQFACIALGAGTLDSPRRRDNHDDVLSYA
jgi:hypothetical protein